MNVHVPLCLIQDEVIAPYSLAFSLDGEKLYAGFLSTVKIFQTCRPGRSCENKPTFGKSYSTYIVTFVGRNKEQCAHVHVRVRV